MRKLAIFVILFLLVGIASAQQAQYPTKHQVVLTWVQAVQPRGLNLTGNNIYRSTTKGGPYILIGVMPPIVRFVDTGVTGGVTYYYVVTSVIGPDGQNIVSAYSNEVAATIPNTTMTVTTKTPITLAAAVQ